MIKNFGLLFQCEHVHHLIQSLRDLQFCFHCGNPVLMVFLCLLVFFFVLLFLLLLLFWLKLACKGEYGRTCFHTLLILVAHPVLMHLQDLSSTSHYK